MGIDSHRLADLVAGIDDVALLSDALGRCDRASVARSVLLEELVGRFAGMAIADRQAAVAISVAPLMELGSRDFDVAL